MIKKLDNGVELYFNSEDEKFKFLYLDVPLSYSDQEEQEDLRTNIVCRSLPEYFQVFSFLINRGWMESIKWTEEYMKKYCIASWWGFEISKSSVMFNKDTIWSIIPNPEQRISKCLNIEARINSKEVNKFRSDLKDLSSIHNFKILWAERIIR